MKKTIKKIKEKLRPTKTPVDSGERVGLSSGSTLLNLACSGDKDIGFLPGHYYLLVGDSASGKTFLTLTCLAEAARHPLFKNYRFIYDNSENGALMDIEKYFGQSVANRLEPPCIDGDGQPKFSTTVEEFYYYVDDAAKEKKPFIYILDSMDSLSSEEEEEKFQERKTNSRKGKETTGSFGTGKAKSNSSGMRRVCHALRETGSILIVISQTRDNLGYGFEKKTRSGGKSLRFYASLELWSSIKEKIKRNVKGKPRTIGIESQVQVKKNRINGKERTISVPLYYSYGIADIDGCINYLIEEGHWKCTKGYLEAPELGFSGHRDDLLTEIEAKGQEEDLRCLVQSVWDEIEAACEVTRKKRYL